MQDPRAYAVGDEDSLSLALHLAIAPQHKGHPVELGKAAAHPAGERMVHRRGDAVGLTEQDRRRLSIRSLLEQGDGRIQPAALQQCRQLRRIALGQFERYRWFGFGEGRNQTDQAGERQAAQQAKPEPGPGHMDLGFGPRGVTGRFCL